MQLKFLQPHISIQAFDPVELQDFTVLTGLNGSGKTHLLQAIAAGHVKIDNLPTSSVKYYNLAQFRVAETGAQNEQQLNQLRQQAWNLIQTGQWQQICNQTYQSSFVENVNGEIVDHFEKDKLEKQNIWSSSSAKLNGRAAEYKTQIEKNLFEHQQFRQQPNCLAVIKAIKKTGLPVNKIEKEEFDGFYTPTVNADNFLSLSIGAIFTNYRLSQYKYIHDHMERGEGNWESLRKEYEKKYPKPWLMFNKILEQIHLSGGGKNVFNFVMTSPENDRLEMSTWQNYVFQPQLEDRNSKQPRVRTH